MKFKTKKRIQGSITILMVIILVPMMTLSALIVDSSRINMARSMVSSAGDLAMNSALADYDTILKDVYGLFAMSQDKSAADLSSDIQKYFEQTLVGYGVTDEENAEEYVQALLGDFSQLLAGVESTDASNFMEMEVLENTFSAAGVSNSSLANADVMRTQIVEYMKYRAPLNLGLSFLDSLSAFSTINEQTAVVEAQVVAQESAQDVTSACKAAISSIRDYDDIVTKMEAGGADAVKGLDNSTDGKYVAIEDYDKQLNKYKQTWGEKYSEINKLNLVFLANAPATSGMYLASMGSTKFIASDGSSVNTANCGINVSVTHGTDTASAKTKFENQRSALSNYKSSAESYKSQNYLPIDGTVIKTDKSAFANEENAIKTYISYERFILSDANASYKYSTAKTILEEIYKLAQYYTKYKSFLDTDVTNAQSAMNEAQNAMTNAQTAKNTADSSVSTIASNCTSYASYIKKAIESLNSKADEIDSTDLSKIGLILGNIKNDDNELLYTEVKGLLDKTYSMPTSKNTVSGTSFYNFSGFMNKFKENTSDTQYFYIKLLGEIATSDLADNGDYKSICKAAATYVDKYVAGKTSNSFGNYNNNSTSYANNDLYELFECLSSCNVYAKKIASYINTYNSNKNKYSDAKSTASQAATDLTNATNTYNQKKSDYESKVNERNTATANYKNSLSEFVGFTNRYQQDISSYSSYQTTAKNVVGKLATAVKTQFSKIQSNLKKLSDQLGVVIERIIAVDDAIIAYEKNIDNWETKNNSYVNANGSDTFSNQNESDIKKTESEYDRDSLNMLLLYVQSEKKCIDELYNFITNSSNYKYGSVKISSIASGDNAKSAVAGTSLSNVVTVNEANNKFLSLYTTGNAPEFLPDEGHQIKFLEPEVLQVQFLRYLNTTYPDEETLTKDQVDSNAASEKNYEEQKAALESNNSGEKTTDDNVGKYGYSYSEKTVPTTDLPSKAEDANTKSTNTDYKLSESEDGDIDVSSGFSAQKSVLSTILGGLGSALSAGLENTYILSYIFENFSCNTTVQSLVRDHVGADAFDSLYKSQKQLNDFSAEFLGKAQTLSNYHINEKQNYLYGAEIEYILYGKTNAAANVTYAKGCIYALRFAFDCIYAFTNTEIKASTMAAGLAVQAATLGVVPYQVVQIVLQLAIAAAEAAIDLEMLSNGAKVAVVKTSETWNLSMTGIASEATNALNIIVGDVVDQVAQDISGVIKGGVQSVVDSTVDELSDSIGDLAEDLASATEAKATEVVESAFAYLQNSISTALNEIQYTTLRDNLNDAKSDAINKINSVFDTADSEIESIPDKFNGNEIAMAVFEGSGIMGHMKQISSSLRSDAIAKVNAATTVTEVGNILVSSVNDLKNALITKVTGAISVVKTSAKSSVSEIAGNIKTEINGYVSQCTDEMTEEAAQAVKDSVSNVTNGFLNGYIAEGNGSASMNQGATGTSGSTGNSVASVIKFGYQDYLMLFTFLAICVNDEAILERVADVIQLNLKNTDSDAEYTHKNKESFLMTKAYTYVTINAEVSLDMLFIDMDFFRNVVSDSDTTVESDFDSSATIKYKGLLGY